MSIVLGAIADDFTGATDLANNLVRAGMRTIQTIGIPDKSFDPSQVDAVVVALKSRSCDAEDAIKGSLEALKWLQGTGAKQIIFKYCSTFDSTEKGNIGPVSDALLDALDADFTVMCPAFPTTGRTVYQGYLFVGDLLLNECGMENHPLNPMTDASLVRVLDKQARGKTGVIDFGTIQEGSKAVADKIDNLRKSGFRYAICDTLKDSDLEIIAEAIAKHKLVTGGSGIAQALPEQYRKLGWLEPRTNAGDLSEITGAALVVSGSCSNATLGQVKHFCTGHEAFGIDPLSLASGDDLVNSAIEWAQQRLGDKPILIYASASSEKVREAQSKLGVERAGQLIENALAQITKELVKKGVRRLVVAGGETSGAVISALGIRSLRIGHQIDPGVPWTESIIEKNKLAIALKSGNFGAEDFFSRSFQVL